MSAEPVSQGEPARPVPATPPRRRLATVRTVPPPPVTTPFVAPGRHSAEAPAALDGYDTNDAFAASSGANGAFVSTTAAPAAVPETPEGFAVRRVRETWAQVEPRADELAEWFAALLFSLDPEVRALFPARITAPARRLLRSLVLPMTVADRPAELTAMLEPLVREHRALGLGAAQYEVLGVALIGAMREFGVAWDDATERAWVRAFSLAAGPMEQTVRENAEPAVAEATVVGHRRLSWDLAVLHVAPDTPLAYRAGQHLSVEVPQRPRMWRTLSPATAPRPDGVLEFHVRAVEGGWVSRAMVAHARPGDRWRLGPAGGRLGVDPRGGRDVLMVAGGTGGAPILALCEDMARWARPRPTTVFLGGRVPEDLTVLDRLRALADHQPWLRVAAVCEADPLDEQSEPGTLPEALVRSGDWSGHDVLLSGSPGMIRATVSALLVDGVALDRIGYDPFTE